MRAALLVNVVVATLVVAGCGGQAKRDKADMQRAARLYAEAIDALGAGDLHRSSDAYREAEDLLRMVRAHASPRGLTADPLPDGPALHGKTARELQEQGQRDMQQAVTDNLGALRDKTAAGKLAWVDVRNFVSYYGPRGTEQRWGEALAAATSGAAGRASDAIVWQCSTSFEEDYCATWRSAFAQKLARPIADATNLNDEVRAAAVGVVDVRWSFGGMQDYTPAGGGPSDDGPIGGAKPVVLVLPTRLEVSIHTTTSHGSSSWDGDRSLVVEAPVPDVVGGLNARDTEVRQRAALKQKMDDKLAALDRQSL